VGAQHMQVRVYVGCERIVLHCREVSVQVGILIWKNISLALHIRYTYLYCQTRAWIPPCIASHLANIALKLIQFFAIYKCWG
jgi:hypothetical protein